MTQYAPYNPEAPRSPEQMAVIRFEEIGNARDLINRSIVEKPRANEVAHIPEPLPRAASAIVGLADFAPEHESVPIAAETQFAPQDVIDIDAAMNAVQAAFDTQALEQG